MKLSGIRYLTKQGFENVWKNKMMAFASFCVLLVSILLIGLSTLLFININSIIGETESKNEVIVFLDQDITKAETEEMKGQLKSMDNVSKVTFYSKDEAFKSMKESMSEYKEIFDSLGDDNPLVDSFRIKIKNISKISETVTLFEGLDNVYSISAPYDFANILTELRRILTLIATAIIIALAIVSMVIISNTTKASVFARRNEISIMKYVGATNAFIRIPFFVEGMITGVVAGLVATVITWVSYDALIDLLNEKVNIISIIGTGTLLPFNKIFTKVILAYVLSGALVGALGSMLSTRKHLNV